MSVCWCLRWDSKPATVGRATPAPRSKERRGRPGVILAKGVLTGALVGIAGCDPGICLDQLRDHGSFCLDLASDASAEVGSRWPDYEKENLRPVYGSFHAGGDAMMRCLFYSKTDPDVLYLLRVQEEETTLDRLRIEDGVEFSTWDFSPRIQKM